jgi:hypothetical protein
MTGLWRDAGEGNPAVEQEGFDAVPASAGASIAAAFGDGLAGNIGGRGLSWLRETMADRLPDANILAPDQANQQYGIAGVLSFDKPVAERTAQDLHQAKHEAMLRADTQARGPQGYLMGGARMAAGFGAGFLDPVNLAAGLVPAVGEVRYANMLANAGSLAARTAVRGAVGAAEGAAGMAVLQPLDYALSRYEGEDYTMGTALRNIAFGAAMGSVLHGGGGMIGEALARAPSNRAALTSLDAGAEARQAALAAGVVQHVQGEPVNVAPLLDTAALRSSYADRQAARGDTGMGNYAAYTPEGQRVELQPQIVELSDLIASNHDDGTINPAFADAAGLQPRDRSNAASQSQITEMASRLEPERLTPSPEAGNGAPIVNAGGAVESGNGRVLALRRVYGDPALSTQADAYKAMLQARGHNIEGMKQPVLIGRRIGDMTPEDSARFVRGANERATLGMNAAEQARADASRAGQAIGSWRPGAVDGPTNKRFVAEFMAQIPAEERAAMIGTDGRLSSAGTRRIQGALLGHAYGDAIGGTLERMLEGDTEHMKSLAGALVDVAGPWGKMRAAAATGEIPAGLDITAAIGEAVQLVDRARAERLPLRELLNQGQLLPTSPAALALVRLMFRDEAMRLPTGRARLAELLARYTEQAEQAKPGPGLFGDAETSAPDILRAIGGDDQRIADAADALMDLARPGGHARPEDTAASKAAQEGAKAAEAAPVGQGAFAIPEPPAAPAARPAQVEPVSTHALPAAKIEPVSTQAPPPTAAEDTQAGLFAAELSPELQHAQRLADEAVATVRAELQAGRVTEADLFELRQADAGVAKAQGDANAYTQAAACLIGKGATA